jgi:hypothetical protein
VAPVRAVGAFPRVPEVIDGEASEEAREEARKGFSVEESHDRAMVPDPLDAREEIPDVPGGKEGEGGAEPGVAFGREGRGFKEFAALR